MGACYDGIPLEILALRLVYMERLGGLNITAAVFVPALAPAESAPGGCRFLYLLGWVSRLSLEFNQPPGESPTQEVLPGPAAAPGGRRQTSSPVSQRFRGLK